LLSNLQQKYKLGNFKSNLLYFSLFKAKNQKIHMKDKRQRSFMKAASWRIFATLTTMIIVFLFTGKLNLTLSIGFFEVVSKLILYYAHERIWDKIIWGKKSFNF
jgi:uncharacterized membrane protein